MNRIDMGITHRRSLIDKHPWLFVAILIAIGCIADRLF